MSADYFPDVYFAAAFWPAGFYGPDAIVVASEAPRGPAQKRRKQSKIAWWLEEQKFRFDEPVVAAVEAAVVSVVRQAPGVSREKIAAAALKKASVRHLAAVYRADELERAVTAAAAAWHAHRNRQIAVLLLL